MQPTALTMVSLYFEKRRSLANGIANSGGPVGGLIFAPLITKLLSSYGYQGCVLIIAGILLNGCVSGALFRPTFPNDVRSEIEFPLDKSENEEESLQSLFSRAESFQEKQERQETQFEQLEDVPINIADARDNLDVDVQNEFRLSYGMDEVQEDGCRTFDPQEINVLKYLTNDETSYHIRSLNSTHACDNNILQSKITSNNENLYQKASFDDADESNICKHKRFPYLQYNRVKAKLHNCKLIRNPLFYAFLIQGALICSGIVVAPIFIAPYAKDIGISVDDIATLVTTQSCIDLVSRVVIGYISDKGWIRRSTIVAISTFVVSLFSCLLGFFTNYTLLLCYSIILGLVSGVYFALFAVVLIDYLTLDNFQTCLGFMALVHGFSVAGSFYLVGKYTSIKS